MSFRIDYISFIYIYCSQWLFDHTLSLSKWNHWQKMQLFGVNVTFSVIRINDSKEKKIKFDKDRYSEWKIRLIFENQLSI